MKTKTSVTLTQDVAKTIDELAVAGESRSQTIQRLLRKRSAAKVRRAADRRDLTLINRHADQLNAEAADVLQYQDDL